MKRAKMAHQRRGRMLLWKCQLTLKAMVMYPVTMMTMNTRMLTRPPILPVSNVVNRRSGRTKHVVLGFDFFCLCTEQCIHLTTQFAGGFNTTTSTRARQR